MSNETVAPVENVETTEAEQVNETPAPTKEEFAAQEGVIQILAAAVATANEAAKKRAALTTGRDEAVREIADNSDDEVIVKARAERDDMLAKVKAAQEFIAEREATILAQANSLVPAANKEEAEKQKAIYLQSKREATAIETTLAVLLGSESRVEDAKKAFGIVSVASTPSGKTADSGEKIERRRLDSVTIDGEVFADNKGKVSFTTLSAKLGVKGDHLRDLAAKAAEKPSVSDIASGEVVTISVTDPKNVAHTVVITFA